MSREQFHHELAESAAGLEAASNAAVHSLGLEPEQFAWFSGKTKHPMKPQPILPDSIFRGHLHDSYGSHITYYGGRAANHLGNFVCGHIQGHIAEPIPEGAMYQPVSTVLPRPFIARNFTVHQGIIEVNTPNVTPSLNDGPLVVSGMGRDPGFNIQTLYKPESGDLTVKHGKYITDGHGWANDQTVEQDALELPDEILLPRLATLLRTIRTASSMFDQIAWRDVRRVAWRITEDDPFAKQK